MWSVKIWWILISFGRLLRGAVFHVNFMFQKNFFLRKPKKGVGTAILPCPHPLLLLVFSEEGMCLWKVSVQAQGRKEGRTCNSLAHNSLFLCWVERNVSVVSHPCWRNGVPVHLPPDAAEGLVLKDPRFSQSLRLTFNGSLSQWNCLTKVELFQPEGRSCLFIYLFRGEKSNKSWITGILGRDSAKLSISAKRRNPLP